MNINVSDFDLVRRLNSAGGHCKVEMIMYHLLSMCISFLNVSQLMCLLFLCLLCEFQKKSK